jgi:hypothetical protein
MTMLALAALTVDEEAFVKRTRKLAQTASQPKEANSRARYPKSKCKLLISLRPAKTFGLSV